MQNERHLIHDVHSRARAHRHVDARYVQRVPGLCNMRAQVCFSVVEVSVLGQTVINGLDPLSGLGLFGVAPARSVGLP